MLYLYRHKSRDSISSLAEGLSSERRGGVKGAAVGAAVGASAASLDAEHRSEKIERPGNGLGIDEPWVGSNLVSMGRLIFDSAEAEVEVGEAGGG